jgi:two-component system NtrC family response regulator
MPLNNFERTTDIRAIVEALRRDGAVVVTELVESSLVDAIRQALIRSSGNISRTAELLGITRPTLYDLIEKHKIDYEEPLDAE